MIGHAALGLASSVLLAGSLVLLFFVVLSGVTHTSPLRHTYFLKGDTSDMAGARDVTQWTYFYVCGANNTDCGHAHAGLALGQAWDRNATGVPAALLGSHAGGTTSSYYFYLWRFGWVFYLVALFFGVCAFATSFLACCGRLGAGVGSLVALAAWVFLSAAVSLMTATFVKARHVLRHNGHAAHLGVYAFGFSWGAWAALFLAVILLCIGTTTGGRSARRRRGSDPSQSPAGLIGDGNATAPTATVPDYAAHDEPKHHRAWGHSRHASQPSKGSLGKSSYGSRQDADSV